MKTDLPAGTWIRSRNNRFEGGFEYGQLTWEPAYTDRYGHHPAEMCWEVGSEPPAGTTVHTVVWKDGGTRIESRGTLLVA